MRARRFLNNVIYWCNIFAALLLLVSFILPYLPPKTFPTLSLLSLFVSLLILLNIIFVIYWVIQLRARFLLSFVVLFISYFYFNVFYEISTPLDPKNYSNTLSVLSYNVRLFNAYEKKGKDKKAFDLVNKMIKERNPDVLCIQEYYKPNKIDFSGYPYQYIHYKRSNLKLGHAIFSKYPLINKGAFDFSDSFNNTLYADVVKNGDTIRLYNLHLQSHGIIPQVKYLQETDTQKLRRRIASSFEKQQNQINAILAHKRKTSHPVIISGDFNNTPFSYSYRKLKDGMKDSFRDRGNGLGTTFLFDKFPLRIDYIFASKKLDVLNFETLEETSSDHFAIEGLYGW